MNPFETSILGFLFFLNQSTKWVIWSLDSQVHKARFVRTRDSQIWIFKDSFRAIVLKICKDSLDSWKQVESLKIYWIRDLKYEPNLFKSGFVSWSPNWIFKSPDSQIRILTNPWIGIHILQTSNNTITATLLFTLTIVKLCTNRSLEMEKATTTLRAFLSTLFTMPPACGSTIFLFSNSPVRSPCPQALSHLPVCRQTWAWLLRDSDSWPLDGVSPLSTGFCLQVRWG